MPTQPSINYVTILKLLGLVFVGLHIPLAVVAVARLGLGVSDGHELLVAAFMGTIAAAVLTLGMMWRMLSAVRQQMQMA